MLLRTFSLFLGLRISFILLLVTYLASARSWRDREKQSPFECGFDPKSSARLPFSLRFFLLGVIFLVFDIEIALLLPIPLRLLAPTIIFLRAIFFFLFILSLGVLHEWNQGSLTWVYNKERKCFCSLLLKHSFEAAGKGSPRKHCVIIV